MIPIPQNIANFLGKQGFAIVSTLDPQGSIHCSAKGFVGLDEEGRLFFIDLYRAHTLNNLKKNKNISATCVNEHEFRGYTLKGTAKIVKREDIKDKVIKEWEQRVVNRISKRVIKNIQNDKKSSNQPEAKFPQPEYLIEMDVEEIVDLAPKELR